MYIYIYKSLLILFNYTSCQDVIIADKSIEILASLRCYFKLSLKTTEEFRKSKRLKSYLNMLHKTGLRILNEVIVLFNKLKIFLLNKSQKCTTIDYNVLKYKVEENPTAKTFQKIIEKWMKKIQLIKRQMILVYSNVNIKILKTFRRARIMNWYMESIISTLKKKHTGLKRFLIKFLLIYKMKIILKQAKKYYERKSLLTRF